MATRQFSGAGDAAFHTLCGLGFGLLVLASVQGPQTGWLHRLLSSRALVWLGLVSYSLYLWHEPLLLWLAAADLLPAPSTIGFPITSAVLLALGLVLAWASYWVIEYPASYLRTRVDGPRNAPAPIVYRARG
jgi:peptidoglycan/LPS O-acetylase OafA/YrhL